MSNFRIPMTNDTASQPPASSLSLFQDPTRYSSFRRDGFSFENLFAALAKELNDLFEEVTACEAELNRLTNPRNSRTHRSSNSSFSTGEFEYREILNMKGDFLENLTSKIDNLVSSAEIPKAKIHCYQKFVTLLKQRYENARLEMEQQMEEVEILKREHDRVDQQVKTFKMLKDEEDDSKKEGDKILQLISEAKKDLNTVLSFLYPDNIKEEFLSAIAQLTEVFMKNDSEEDQYVELFPETLKNNGIICLIKSHVIIEDPSNPSRYRLNMEE